MRLLDDPPPFSYRLTMRREQRPTQEVLNEVLAQQQSSEAEPEPEEAPPVAGKMSNLKFVARVVGEILENLPHNT